MKRRILASVLSVAMIVTLFSAMSVNASAAGTTHTPTDRNDMQAAIKNANPDAEIYNAQVTAIATILSPSYVVTIPEKIEFGNLEKSKEDNIISKAVTVTASGISNLFVNQKKLVVTASSKNTFVLKDAGEKSSIPYKIYCNAGSTPLVNDGTVLEASGASSGDTNLTVAMNGQAKLNTKDISKAGNYTDILTFNVALQEVNS